MISGPHNLVDPKRIVIRGRSADSYTALAAISNGPDASAFAAGTSSYGISDLKPLAEDMHKFESHYLFKLIGGAFDEVSEIYEERSPINRLDNIVVPLLASGMESILYGISEYDVASQNFARRDR